MDKVFINIKELNNWIAKYFPNKDMITFEDMISVIEDLDYEIDSLKEKIEKMEQDIQDNYKPISPYSMYGISENDFH